MAERGDQNLLDVGLEGDVVHRAVEDHGRGHAIDAQRAREGGRFPVTVRHGCAAALAFAGAALDPGHLGRGAGLVDGVQAPGVEVRLAVNQARRRAATSGFF